MFDKSYIVHYRGHNGMKGTCGAEIHTTGNSKTVVLTELDTNQGMSVTNAVELIAAQVLEDNPELVGQTITWIEHYPHARDDETYDLVELNENLQNPSWKRIDISEYIS